MDCFVKIELGNVDGYETMAELHDAIEEVILSSDFPGDILSYHIWGRDESDPTNPCQKIYALVGANGEQCIDRIKHNFENAGLMREALSRIYDHPENAKEMASAVLEKL